MPTRAGHCDASSKGRLIELECCSGPLTAAQQLYTFRVPALFRYSHDRHDTVSVALESRDVAERAHYTQPRRSFPTGGSFPARHLPVALFPFGSAADLDTAYLVSRTVGARLHAWNAAHERADAACFGSYTLHSCTAVRHVRMTTSVQKGSPEGIKKCYSDMNYSPWHLYEFNPFLLSSFPFLSFPFLSFPFLSFPFLSFPFLSSPPLSFLFLSPPPLCFNCLLFRSSFRPMLCSIPLFDLVCFRCSFCPVLCSIPLSIFFFLFRSVLFCSVSFHFFICFCFVLFRLVSSFSFRFVCFLFCFVLLFALCCVPFLRFVCFVFCFVFLFALCCVSFLF